MTRDEALTEITVAMQQGLELTGEWGKVVGSPLPNGLCWLTAHDIAIFSVDEFIPQIADALERKIKDKLGRYIILNMKSLVQICRWDYLANRLPDRIIGEGQDKLSALWEALKRLNKEQKQ